MAQQDTQQDLEKDSRPLTWLEVFDHTLTWGYWAVVPYFLKEMIQHFILGGH